MMDFKHLPNFKFDNSYALVTTLTLSPFDNIFAQLRLVPFEVPFIL